MLILTLNTASRNNELLLSSNSELLIHESWLSERNEASTLLPRIEKLLESQKKTFQDLTHLLVITGPGGFTSIRVGVSIANALVYSLKLETAGITLFDWWKNKLGDTSDTLLISSATGDSVFVQDSHEDKCQLVAISEVKTQMSNSLIDLKGELIEKHAATLSNWKESKLHDLEPDLGGLLDSIQFEKGRIIEPFYGRSAVSS